MNPPTVRVLLERQLALGDDARADAATRALPPSSMATLRKPESNDGVWILYGQQKWISAGPPVPFEESAFQRIGEYRRVPGLQADTGK